MASRFAPLSGTLAANYARELVQRHGASNDEARDEATPAIARDGEAPRPAMEFATPVAPPTPPGGVEPSQTATEEGGASTGAPLNAAPKAADARAVAERVYDLMKTEVRVAQQRGVVRRRG